MSYIHIDVQAKMSYYVIYWRISMKIEGIPARINQNGRIVIPAVIRKAMGLKLGDSVILSLDDGILHIAPYHARPRRAQASSPKPIPHERVLSEEPIAERREESKAETEEWLG